MPTSCPPPVYAAEGAVIELTTAEMFPVLALRLWVMPLRDPAGPHPDWRRGFVAAGIDEEGAPAFDALFRIVAASLQRGLDIRCPRCATLGTDEALLLQLMAALQNARFEQAEAFLDSWLPPAPRRIAMLPATRFAQEMSQAGLRVPLRHREAAARPPAAAGHPHRGLYLVQ